jgi:hypothetical protein
VAVDHLGEGAGIAGAVRHLGRAEAQHPMLPGCRVDDDEGKGMLHQRPVGVLLDRVGRRVGRGVVSFVERLADLVGGLGDWDLAQGGRCEKQQERGSATENGAGVSLNTHFLAASRRSP